MVVAAKPARKPLGKIKALPLGKIMTNLGTQPRVELDQVTIKQYQYIWENPVEGEEFPPLLVFWDGFRYILADGFHRWHGAKLAGKRIILCEIRDGTVRDAWFWGLNANARHPKPLSNVDKRNAITTLLNELEWCKMSDNAIAQHVGCSAPTVAAVRRELEESKAIPPMPTRISKNGVEKNLPTRDREEGSDFGESSLDEMPAPSAAPVEPQQRTENSLNLAFLASLRKRRIQFEAHYRCESLGVVGIRTPDAFHQVVQVMTVHAFREAFANCLLARQMINTGLRAVIVGRMTDEIAPWVEAARTVGVEFQDVP